MGRKKFAGISFTPLEINLSRLDGYAITALSVAISMRDVFTGTVHRSLLHVGFHNSFENRGHVVKLRIALLFLPAFTAEKWVIKQPLDRCLQCEGLCESKESYSGSLAYCSAECAEDYDYFQGN